MPETTAAALAALEAAEEADEAADDEDAAADVADAAASLAFVEAMTACSVTSEMVASVVASPAPPVPR